MNGIIINGGDATRNKVIQQFDAKSVIELVNGMTDAIAHSFVSHPMRNFTQQEKKRRFDILLENTLTLRAEHKWGVRRICDAMPDILKCELSGTKYQANDKRTTWVASDGS
jgi:hypothetical protein